MISPTALRHIQNLRVKIFADGADREAMLSLAREPYIKGLTTNPTLMQKAGITDYEAFAKDILSVIKDKPVSFEVFSDNFDDMERQARIINSWGNNVYVKIPITNSKGESSFALVQKLSAIGIKLNVTAILTREQVTNTIQALSSFTPAIVSVFAGRIADTGVNAIEAMREAKRLVAHKPNVELLWASSRQLYNIFEAEAAGTDIITVSSDILKKIQMVGYDLSTLSLETVKMFYDDGKKSGFTLADRSTGGVGYIESYLNDTVRIAQQIDITAIDAAAKLLHSVREAGGRLFILGVGGSAANASHAVNDFRKIAQIEAYAPTDNVGELTARTNDDGWESVFAAWLNRSNLSSRDAVMVLSVGGGNAEKNVSANIVHALRYAKDRDAKILGIVSRDGGYTRTVADVCVLVPVVNPDTVTPHAESWQAVVWHALVFHPLLKKIEGKWESLKTA